MTSSNYHFESADPILEAFHAHQRVKQIQAAFDDKAAKSKILQSKLSKERLDTLALLHRSDIETGMLLGEGAFSQVFEVKSIDLSSDSCTKDPKTQALCEELNEKARQGQLVLKQLKPDVKNFTHAAADLAAEAAFLMRLSHEHLVSLRASPANFIRAFASTDGFFLLLDRVETTLADALKLWSRSNKNDVPSPAQRVDYAQQLASVLQYLHEQGIVYRDLKPDNVGLSPSTHHIQLFDFGLSRQLPSLSANMEGAYEMSRAGTPRYMAPEVALMNKYNTQADVYSWAILVWEMMSVCRAFPGLRSKELCQKTIVEGDRPPLKAVPVTKLQPILARAWHAKPNKRPDMASLVEQLSSVQETKFSLQRFGFLRRRAAVVPRNPPPRHLVLASCG